MRTVAHNIHAALAISALGISGGIALGAYTEGGMWPQSRVPVEDAAGSGRARADTAVWQVKDYPPVDDYQDQSHVCRGCGPTLAERQMQTYLDRLYSHSDEAVVEPVPLPPEEPVPAEAEAQPDMTEGVDAETPPPALPSSGNF